MKCSCNHSGQVSGAVLAYPRRPDSITCRSSHTVLTPSGEHCPFSNTADVVAHSHKSSHDVLHNIIVSRSMLISLGEVLTVLPTECLFSLSG
jgi:hypothetical protein